MNQSINQSPANTSSNNGTLAFMLGLGLKFLHHLPWLLDTALGFCFTHDLCTTEKYYCEEMEFEWNESEEKREEGGWVLIEFESSGLFCDCEGVVFRYNNMKRTVSLVLLESKYVALIVGHGSQQRNESLSLVSALGWHHADVMLM